MGLFRANGTRVTRSNIVTAAAPDPLLTVNEDLYERRSYGRNDLNPDGSILTLKQRAGKVLRTSEVDNLFPPATIDSVSPASGPAAGGTVVTIKGSNLDGVTAVAFGASNGTALTVVKNDELRVTTPAGTAGAKNVVLTDDAGTVTKTGGYTYT